MKAITGLFRGLTCRILAASVTLLFCGGAAEAALFSFTDVDLPGMTFSLDRQIAPDLNTSDTVSDTYDFVLTLTVDAGAYQDQSGNDANADPNSDYLSAVSVLFGVGALDQVSVYLEPTGSWVEVMNQAVPGNSGTCASSSGGICWQDVTAVPNLRLQDGGTYQWKFLADLGSGGLSSVIEVRAGIGDIKGSTFTNEDTFVASANNVADSPTDPAPVPEPGSLALLGSGLVVTAGALRRRFRQRDEPRS